MRALIGCCSLHSVAENSHLISHSLHPPHHMHRCPRSSSHLPPLHVLRPEPPPPPSAASQLPEAQPKVPLLVERATQGELGMRGVVKKVLLYLQGLRPGFQLTCNIQAQLVISFVEEAGGAQWG
jgi:hypothetical protein